jgi:serine/threonine protein kinase
MADLSLGSTIAGCRLEAVAGRGGMGVVYRATQLALGRLVALKAVAPELSGDDDFRQRFQRESHIAASIDHPNVIPVYEAGELDGTLYLIMRWVDGTDLRALLTAEGRLSPVRAVRLLRPVALALAAAHRRGLVHRDVKPANVLITRGDEGEDEHVYLTDFGIARRTQGESAMTRTGVLVGTIDYTAPERIEGGKGTSASDIYSFGCMLYETLTGHPPFDRPTEVSKMFAHLNDPAPAARDEVPEVPGQLDAIIAKAMAKRPADRFASAGELALALADVDTSELALAAKPAGPESPRTKTQRSKTVPAIAHGSESTVLADRSPTPATSVTRNPPPRKWVMLAVGVALLVIAGVVVAVVAGGGGTRTEAGTTSSSPAVGAEASSSSPGLSVRRTIDLRGTPAAAAADPSGNVWVSLPALGKLERVAPGGQSKSFSLGGRPTALAAGSSGVWVAGAGSAPLSLIDPASGAKRLTVALLHPPKAITVSATNGAAWTVDASGAVVEVDTTGHQVEQPPVTPPPDDIGSGEGWIWAVNSAPNGLVRIGQGTIKAFDAGPAPVSVTFDQGVWTAHGSGEVTRFNPQSAHLNLNATVHVSSSLNEIDAVEHATSVFAIGKQAKTLYRISNAHQPSSTGTVAFRSAPLSLAVTDDSVWVATADGKLVQIASTGQ